MLKEYYIYIFMHIYEESIPILLATYTRVLQCVAIW